MFIISSWFSTYYSEVIYQLPTVDSLLKLKNYSFRTELDKTLQMNSHN